MLCGIWEVKLEKRKIKDLQYYLDIIDQIEKVRTKNNVNWMDLLRLAFTYPENLASIKSLK